MLNRSDSLEHTIRVNSSFDRSRYKSRTYNIHYFFAFEGLTEYLYLKGIKENLITKNRRAEDIDLVLLIRESYIKDCSDPKFNMQRLRDYIHAVSDNDRKEISPGMAVGKMILQLLDMEEPHLLSDEKFQYETYQYVVSALENSECIDKHYITDEEQALEVACKAFLDKNIDPAYVEDLDYPVFESKYNEKTDKIFLIVDRDFSRKIDTPHDYEERDREYYRQLVKECRDAPDNDSDLKHIKLIVTNPCFEFWLMLHFEDVLSLTPDETEDLQTNAWVKSEGKRYSEVLMNKILLKNCKTQYRKTKIDFKNHYMKRMQDAIEHAESFCVNLDRLEREIGSNMGKLLTEILKYPER